jgi:hypothetical protein
VRHTGSDRRQRQPVPREQHRHEQLQPLHRHIRSFAHTRSSRQSNARCVFSRVYPGSGIPVGYPKSTLECPRLRATGVPGRGPPSCCAHASRPQCTRTAKRSGRLATASSACQTKPGWQNCKARREGPPTQFWGRQGSSKPHCGDGRVRCGTKGRARRQARGTGWECSGRSQRACLRCAACARRRAARRAWQRSAQPRAGYGMAITLP